MRVLLIGGTGTISLAVSRCLLEQGNELYLLNRGNRNNDLPGIREIACDIHEEASVTAKLKGLDFDAVADFIAFGPEDLERDFRIFAGKTKQFIFISSASAYQKPPSDYIITESTPLINPFWEYSRKKIAGEDFLMEKYRTEGFPVTIVRPSHTYNERKVPLAVHGNKGSWQVLKRMLEGKPVIIHGDGSSLWTLTHNSDFAAGFTGLIGNPHALGQTVQIMTDESLTWDQIYEIIAGTLGVKLNCVHISSDFLAAAGRQFDFEGELLGDKSRTVVFDISKLRRLVPDFKPEITMANGIRNTVRYVSTHRECQIPDQEFDTWCDAVIAARQEALKKLDGKNL